MAARWRHDEEFARISKNLVSKPLMSASWAWPRLAMRESSTLPAGKAAFCNAGRRLPRLLAFGGETGTSVIRIRIEGLRAAERTHLLADVLEVCGDDLSKGAMVSVTENGIRIWRLPLLR